MSPPGDVPQTPEAKATGGFAGVFKSLTGAKLTKSPLPPAAISAPSANVQVAQQLHSTLTKRALYGGPPNFEQLYQQLKSGNTLSERTNAAVSLRHTVRDYPLTEVTSIWYAGKDLINPSNPQEARIIGYELLTACVQHASATDLERREYFDTLTAPLHPDDFHLQLAALVELSKHGKDLSGFHYEAFPLLTRWLHDAFTASLKARKQTRGAPKSKNRAPLGEETNLSSLFDFVVDVIKFGGTISGEDNDKLIDEIIEICVSATVTADIKACIGVLDALVIFGGMPSHKLQDCIRLLSSIHGIVPEAQENAWKTISKLSKSHYGQSTVRYLLDILKSSSTESRSGIQTREIRGALSVLDKLMAKDGKKGYPLVPFTLLMDALSKVSEVSNTKVDLDILNLISSLFSGENSRPKDNVMEEDWSLMLKVVRHCSRRALDLGEFHPPFPLDRTNSIGSNIGSVTSSTRSAKGELETNIITSISHSLYRLVTKLEDLLDNTEDADFVQREDCVRFFADVRTHLPETSACLVVDYYSEFRLCYPSDPSWQLNVQLILGSFFSNTTFSTTFRRHALRTVTDVYEVIELMDDHEDPDCVRKFGAEILDKLATEKEVLVLEDLVDFAISVATDTCDLEVFNDIISKFHSSITIDSRYNTLSSPTSRPNLLSFVRSSSPATSDSSQHKCSPSSVITKGLIQIFMRSMDRDSRKAFRVFDEILWIAKTNSLEVDARISAVRLLFRLRADWARRIFLTPFTESGALAALLYRTSESVTQKHAVDEIAQQSRTTRPDELHGTRLSRSGSTSQIPLSPGPLSFRMNSRSASSVHRTLQQTQMWMHPDPDGLPDYVSDVPSSILASCSDADEGRSIVFPSARKVLKIDVWLETIIDLMQGGCDWEVYSYVLVHLPAQLSNQGLFWGAIPQIKILRALICEQIRTSSFQEPPVASGLRKADIAICLFQTLTMLLSYHDHFSKVEDDDMVRTFVLGIGSWERTAKCCIHALSICCHELPASLSRSLVTILQKMSQIITQSQVAVHILEFLSCLCRLPDLYVNFREDEYRTVFGICFRYLQYVRDQPQKESRGNHLNVPTKLSIETSAATLHPAPAQDLPQYVYALAYHVITFWFLSLRLSDRAGLVSWITRNLVSTDSAGKEVIDEQAQVTIDFMQRVTYADVDDSKADPTFKSEEYGEILKRRWVLGNSIVTIEQTTRGGLAQITRRQPSGTSCYIIRENYERPPAYQTTYLTDAMRDARHTDSNVVLPAHLMLQLIAQPLAGAARPVPLPDDDMIRRAIASFDRNSTVDGHKVGVIFIGENQTKEQEILANVMGTDDYTDFLEGLGTLTPLRGATFNTQGLDRSCDMDGRYTYCWRDRVTEVVFHVTTQMPTNIENDPQCIGKKRHIGNDFVNIIFNNSGLPFDFDTFPSEFNYVYIVITPESRASFVASRLRSDEKRYRFYKVQLICKPGFPEISPAFETKIVSLKALPHFVRLLALNASVFSLVWSNREGGEHISSWRNRLREIVRLREKYGGGGGGRASGNGSTTGSAPTSNTTSPPASAHGPASSAGHVDAGSNSSARNVRDSLNQLRRSSVATFLTNSDYNSQRSSVLSTPDTEIGPGPEESLVEQLDFSRWA